MQVVHAPLASRTPRMARTSRRASHSRRDESPLQDAATHEPRGSRRHTLALLLSLTTSQLAIRPASAIMPEVDLAPAGFKCALLLCTYPRLLRWQHHRRCAAAAAPKCHCTARHPLRPPRIGGCAG